MLAPTATHRPSEDGDLTTASDTTATPPPTIIAAPGRWPDPGLRELWRHRSIAVVLARRNLNVRYRQTILGVAWVLIQPLSLMLVFSIFFGWLGGDAYYGIPFPVFFLTALTLWLPAMKVVTEGTASLLANAQLVTRVYVPRALIPASVAVASMIDLIFLLISLAVTLALFLIPPSPALLAVPFLVLVAYATGLGVSYWFSALNVAYRDVQVGLPFIDRIWFFSSPILYPAEIVPEAFQPIYFLNPMALVIEGARWAFAGAPPPPPIAWVEGTGVAALLLVTGYLFFRRREPMFADVL
jgi:lipopolysaccharide transport system permease protein